MDSWDYMKVCAIKSYIKPYFLVMYIHSRISFLFKFYIFRIEYKIVHIFKIYITRT